MRTLAAVPILLALLTAGSGKPVPKPVIEFRTSMGTFAVELWPEAAPATVENFLGYVADGHFAGTIFHRVVKGFVIQGGGYTPELREKSTRPPVRLEAREPNKKYTLAMARTNDPHSATSQFFINLRDNTSLDPGVRPPGYAVFGRVIRGTDVIDKIAQVPVAAQGEHQHLPVTPVVIQSVGLAQ